MELNNISQLKFFKIISTLNNCPIISWKNAQLYIETPVYYF